MRVASLSGFKTTFNGRCSVGKNCFENLNIRRIVCESKGVEVDEFFRAMNGTNFEDFYECSNYLLQDIESIAQEVSSLTPKRCDTFISLEKQEEEYVIKLNHPQKEQNNIVTEAKSKNLQEAIYEFSQKVTSSFFSGSKKERTLKNNVGVLEYILKNFN